ncbi:50S ribosome-binding GTPase [Leptolyngbya sp. FACHB-261]|nr:50S ribosome-binding GTPase [Leptolyngbya sp. FACHB-261]
MPTTEVLLVGKPQTGKSSIVQALTGASKDIVGQGFRPHTAHTQRYSYPAADLPLMVFIDTVGLGDGAQETSEVIQELTGLAGVTTSAESTEELDLDERDLTDQLTDGQAGEERPAGQLALAQPRARILVVTVRLTDFANDTLRQIVSKIRQRHPEVPCLLAVTCLHEAYSDPQANHPDYPPSDLEVQRAMDAAKQAFAGLYDRVVAIDFTQPEDGYEPVLYGLDAFASALCDLLPDAEARAIGQLLDTRAGLPDQVGDLYRQAGRRYIATFAVMAGTVAAVPLPLATMPVLTTLQITLVSLLGKLYGQNLNPSQAGGVVSTIAGGFVAQAVGRELVKAIPILGSVVAASWATAYTWALGEGACVYFGDLMGGKKPNPEQIQRTMQEAFREAQERFRDTLTSSR